MILDIINYCDSPVLAKIFEFTKKVLQLIQIIGPILAMVSILYQLSHLMVNPGDKKLHKKLLNSFLALIILFFVSFIESFSMKFADDSFSFSTCWNYGAYNTSEGEFYYIKDTDMPSQSFIIDPDDYDSNSITVNDNTEEAKTEGVTASNFLSSLDRMSKVVQRDKKNGHPWLYSNSNTKNTFSGSNNSSKSTNCALYAVWGYVDLGIIRPGDRFYKDYKNGSNYIKYRNGTESRLRQYVDIIDGNNVKAKTLIKEGKLLAGDVVLWHNIRHTNIYAGNYQWYDAGRQGGVNGSGTQDKFLFKTLGPIKLPFWGNQRVWKIMRIK